jgi:hypothetical protein
LLPFSRQAGTSAPFCTAGRRATRPLPRAVSLTGAFPRRKKRRRPYNRLRRTIALVAEIYEMKIEGDMCGSGGTGSSANSPYLVLVRGAGRPLVFEEDLPVFLPLSSESRNGAIHSEDRVYAGASFPAWRPAQSSTLGLAPRRLAGLVQIYWVSMASYLHEIRRVSENARRSRKHPIAPRRVD